MEIKEFSILLFLLIPIVIFLTKKSTKKLPPGSMGLPLVGQSLSFVRALRANKGEEWLHERINKYGPISKLNLFGKPTIFLHGKAANKFVYMSDSSTLANNQPASIRRIIGERNIMELSGEEHKRVRGALVSFLKPEVLRRYVGKIDEEVREHLKIHWHGPNDEVKVSPLMKTLTFSIICSLIFGIEKGERRDSLKSLFNQLMEGLLSVPVNLPFTRFNRSLKARAKLEKIIMDIIQEKKEALRTQRASPAQDLITSLLNSSSEGDTTALSDCEILDNVSIIMIAGHDTTSILLTMLIRLFALEPSIFTQVIQEHEQVAKTKKFGEPLNWDDLIKMKYTWGLAMETLRMTPSVFCSFRKAVRDIEYEGYIIPKGWQVVWAACMTHMDEKIFKDPMNFDEKRFEQQPQPHSFVAFGGGPRICPGYEFAKIETLVLIHHLVAKFTWKLNTDDSSFSRDPLPEFKDGLPISIIPKTA